MSNLTTLPKGDSAWLFRKAIERIIQQISDLETNIGSSTTGNSANQQIIFNDNGTLRGDAGLVYNSTTDALTIGGNVQAASATITGDLTVDTSTLKVDSANNQVSVGTTSRYGRLTVGVGSGLQAGTTTNVAHALYDVDYASTGDINTRLSFANSNGATNAAIDRIGNPYFNDNGNLAFLTRSGAGSLTERYRIAADGVATWSEVGGVAGTAMTLNATGLGVKGTIGTSSGDSVIAFGARGVIVGNNGSAIASGSYIDIAVITTGAGYQGFLSVANSNDASANTRTQTTFSVFGRGASSTITQIATANGSIAGASFTVTTPSNGLIRITNTSGQPTTIAAQFFGATSL